jgi:hypothetical protein
MAMRSFFVCVLLITAVAPASAQSPSATPSRSPVGGSCVPAPGASPSPVPVKPSIQPDATPFPAPTLAPTASEPAAWPTLGGTAHRIADAPFGADWPLGVWTGKRAIVNDLVTGRTLSYDPGQDRWRRLARSPAGLDQARALWTGDRMLLAGDLPDDGGVTAWAFDPRADAWGPLTQTPFAGHLADAAWAEGAMVIRIDPLPDDQGLPVGEIGYHIFDSAAGCWRDAARPDPIDARLVGVAGRILGIGPRSVSTLDPSTGIWSAPAPRPVRDDEPGIVIDERVVFLTDGKGGESYDPATGTWATIATTCPILSGSSVAGGTLIIGDTFAFDTATNACYRLPNLHDRHRGFAFYQWMDDQLLIWSGGKSEDSRGLPDGIAYRPILP